MNRGGPKVGVKHSRTSVFGWCSMQHAVPLQRRVADNTTQLLPSIDPDKPRRNQRRLRRPG